MDIEPSRLNREQLEGYLNEQIAIVPEEQRKMKNSVLLGALPIYRVMNGIGEVLAVKIYEQSMKKIEWSKLLLI